MDPIPSYPPPPPFPSIFLPSSYPFLFLLRSTFHSAKCFSGWKRKGSFHGRRRRGERERKFAPSDHNNVEGKGWNHLWKTHFSGGIYLLSSAVQPAGCPWREDPSETTCLLPFPLIAVRPSSLNERFWPAAPPPPPPPLHLNHGGWRKEEESPLISVGPSSSPFSSFLPPFPLNESVEPITFRITDDIAAKGFFLTN